MKKLIMGLVAALIATTTPAMAAYYKNVGVASDGSCTWVNTNHVDNAWWINHLAIMDYSDVAGSIEYHSTRANRDNFHSIALCWLEWFQDQDEDQLALEVENALGFNPITAMDLTDDYAEVAFYLTLDVNALVAVPGGFMTLLHPDLRTDFVRGWLIANAGMNGYRGAPEVVLRNNASVSYLEAWKSDWNAIMANWDASTHPRSMMSDAEQHAAEITEYFY